MTKTELLAKLTSDGEERLMLARAMDKMDGARNRSIPACTPFLSPGQRVLVEQLIAASGHPAHLFYGGYEGAERTVCVFLPDWMDGAQFLAEPTLAAVRVVSPLDAALSHRDYLGSILGLGLTREKIGDLLIYNNVCQVILFEETRHILLTQLGEVGRYPVKVSEQPLEDLEIRPAADRVHKRDTFNSLRLDAVTASAFGLPRTKAAALISSGKVLLNHRECDKPDRLVEAGDALSCRGLGKCVLTAITGQSKKGRIMVEMELYR